MKALFVAGAALAPFLLTQSALAAAANQPPMNNFNSAFYTCDGGEVFHIDYDSERPTKATVTTSDNKTYNLKRTQAPNGIQFSDDKAKFWTDGTTATIEGAAKPLKNCKAKTS